MKRFGVEQMQKFCKSNNACVVPTCVSVGGGNLAAPKLAFTLAEVLITLGIIGVVAAMTMPTLIQNYRRKVVEKKLYTTYNILQNMVRMSAVDNGDPYNWVLDNDDDEIFEKYFAPYLKIIEKCSRKSSVYCDTSMKGISGTDTNVYKYKYILSNGVGIIFAPGATLLESRRKGTFFVDILSGPKDRIIGRNVFTFNFIVDRDKYFITGAQDYPTTPNVFCNNIKNNRESAINDCKSGKTSSGFAFGIYCTALIECNNWVIPKDYPIGF